MAAFVTNYGKAWIAAVLIACVLFWLAGGVMIMLVAAVLGAVFLSGAATTLSRYLPVSKSTSVIVVTIGMFAIAVGTGFIITPIVKEQIDQLTERLPALLNSTQNTLTTSSWGRWTLAHLPSPAAFEEMGQTILGTVPGVFRTTFGGIFNLALIAILSFYLALDSRRHLTGFVRMFPSRHRHWIEDLISRMGGAVRGWLLAQMISMSLLGILTFIGLSIIGIPLAFLLGLLTALLTFIPNLGPVLSVTPPILLALAQDPILALWVIALYAGLQFLEGNIVTPLVLRQVIDMPPAVLLSVQLLAAGFLGFWGLVLAAPLTAAAQVLIEEIHFKRMDRRAEGDVESVENEIPPLDPAHAEGGHVVRSA